MEQKRLFNLPETIEQLAIDCAKLPALVTQIQEKRHTMCIPAQPDDYDLLLTRIYHTAAAVLPPPAPAATGEAGERERRLLDTVRLALEHDAPHVRLGTFNWPVYMRELLQLFEATRAQLQQATAAAEGAGEALAEYKRNGITLVDNVKGWGTYQHYKGGFYRVLASCRNEADGRTMVVYLDLATRQQWVRPEDEFFGEVTEGVRRFKPAADAPLATPAAAEPGEGRGEVVGTYEVSGLPVYETDDYVTDVEGCYLTREEAEALRDDAD